MIPGQQVNKDVYAVNTGSMDAFVKETISGVLNYTYETRVSTWDADCIELTSNTPIDGVTTEEGGAFLAYAPAGVQTGVIRSERVEDATAGRWTPEVEGLYIFRRSITNAVPDDPSTEDVDESKPETYTYAAYYYKPGAEGEDGKFYKVVLRADNYRAEEEIEGGDDATNGGKRFVFDISVDGENILDASGNPVTIGEKGVIETAPQYYFVKDKTLTNQDVDLTYVSAEESAADGTYNGAPYLAVRYNNADPNSNAASAATQAAVDEAKEEEATKKAAMETAKAELEEAQSDFATLSAAIADLEVAKENAIRAYNSAKSRYDQTNSDYNYARDLAKATNALYAAAQTRAEAEATDISNSDALKAAIKAVKDEIFDDKNNTNSTDDTGIKVTYKNKVLDLGDTDATAGTDDHGISPDDLVPADIQTQLLANRTTLADAYNNWQGLYPKWENIKSLVADIKTQLDNIEAISETSTPAEIEGYETALIGKLGDLETALDDYKASYTQFKTAAGEANMTGLNADTHLTVIEDYKTNNVTVMKNDITPATTDPDKNLAQLIDEYVEAYNTYHDGHDGASSAYETAKTNWTTAITDYNNAVNAAKGVYEGTTDLGINAPQTTPNAFAPNGTLTDNSSTLVPQYSAKTTGSNPAIAADADFTNFVDGYNATTGASTQKANKTAPVGIGTEPATTFVDSTSDDNGKDFVQLVANYPDPSTETTPQTVAALKDALDSAEDAKNSAENAYTSANSQDIRDARTAVETKQVAYDVAEAEYNTAKANRLVAQRAHNDASADSNIQFDIVLAQDAEDNWEYKNQNGTTDYKKADFYYKHILEDGETSEKLVDYVAFLDTVTAKDYKDLTFDINVELKSAQVTYADNQTTPTAVAVQGNATDFQLTVEDANITAGTPDGYDVAWTAR